MAHPARLARLRRRKFSRLRRLNDNLREFFAAQSARLAASASARTCTFDNTTDVVSSTAHGFLTGKGPINFANSGGALPTGLTATARYWPIKIDADTFNVASSRANACAGVKIDFSTNGSGTNTAKYDTSAQGLFERLKHMRISFRTLLGVSDIDNL